MRMTREELKEKWFTSWNDSRNDIVESIMEMSRYFDTIKKSMKGFRN